MDSAQFDRLTSLLAATGSRRRGLAAAALGLGSVVSLSLFGVNEANARRKQRRKRRNRKGNGNRTHTGQGQPQDQPPACIPDCTGKVCGPDSCGGSCGPGCADGEPCLKKGTNCGGTNLCGLCPAGLLCDWATNCVPEECLLECADRECGFTSCGANCGTCPILQTCVNGTCVPI
jgi:hypothetical protein